MATEIVTASQQTTDDPPPRVERSLDTYRLLGRSGLRVSPMALGTMTFGTDWGWGADEAESRKLFDAYVERGGNFIDTANNYTNGTSERLLGEFARDRRDQLVIATKYTCWTRQGDPNSGGNHRKSMIASVESSLEAAADRLHRPPLPPRLGRHDAGRGDPAWTRRPRPLRQGALRRDLRHPRVADLADAGDRRAARLGAAGRAADRIQPDRADDRARADPDGTRDGPGRAPWAPLAKGVLTGKYTRADLDRPTARKPARTSPPRQGCSANADWPSPTSSVTSRPRSAAHQPRSPWPGRCSTRP